MPQQAITWTSDDPDICHHVASPQRVKHVTYPCPYLAYIPWQYYGYLNQGQSWYGLSQWKPRLHCNIVFHWLNQYPDPSLLTYSWDLCLGCMGYSLCVLIHTILILLMWWRIYIWQLFLTCMKLPQKYGYRFCWGLDFVYAFCLYAIAIRFDALLCFRIFLVYFGIYDLVTVLYVFQMTCIWYQMKCDCSINYISTKLKQNDHPLTNYVHINDPTPNVYPH